MKSEITLNTLTLSKGSAVMESYAKGFVPVINDLGSKVVCFDQASQEEYTIDKTNLSAIYKNGDVAFLPDDLSLDESFNFDRLHGAQRKWLEFLDDNDRRLLRPLVGMYLVDCPKISRLIEDLNAAKEIDLEDLEERFSISKPYSTFGQFHPLKASYNFVSKHWTINFFGTQMKLTFETMFYAFKELYFRAMLMPIEDLSDVDLMAYYRIKGYILKLEPEYNLWKLHKLHSTKTLMMNYDWNVRDFSSTIDKLDKFINASSFVQPEPSTPYEYKQLTLKAFTIPQGSIAVKSFFTLDNSDSYYIHQDHNQKVLLQKIDYEAFTLDRGDHTTVSNYLLEEPFEVARKAISYVIPRSDVCYLSARFVPFGIESKCESTFEALSEQQEAYFGSLTKAEQIQEACLYLLSPFNRLRQNEYIQAQKENDIAAIFDLLHKKRDLEDNNRFVHFNNSTIVYTPDSHTKAKYKYDDIADTIFKMIHNAKTLPPKEMSLQELRLHYTLIGDYVLDVYPNNFMVLRDMNNILNHVAFHSHKQSPTDVETLISRLQRD